MWLVYKMCACKIEEETDFRSIILHRKERRSNKPLPKDVEWMLEKSEEQENLFQRLPSNQDNILPLDRQTYQQWKALYETQKFAHPIRMRRRSIILQPLSYSSPCYRFSSIDPGIVECLTEFCRCFFTGMDILTTPPIDISEVNKIRKRVHDETGREQLLADDLLRYLKSHVLRNSFCVVGVIIADLYPSDNWNFTLGHASLTDGVAIVSFGRHFNSSDMDNVLTPYQLQLTNLWTLVNVSNDRPCITIFTSELPLICIWTLEIGGNYIVVSCVHQREVITRANQATTVKG